MARVAKKQSKKVKKAGFFKFAVCLFVVYVVYVLLQQQFDIRDREMELALLQQQVEEQKLENKEMERLLSSDNNEYVERVAKDEYNYAYPDETIYIDTSGS